MGLAALPMQGAMALWWYLERALGYLRQWEGGWTAGTVSGPGRVKLDAEVVNCSRQTRRVARRGVPCPGGSALKKAVSNGGGPSGVVRVETGSSVNGSWHDGVVVQREIVDGLVGMTTATAWCYRTIRRIPGRGSGRAKLQAATAVLRRAAIALSHSSVDESWRSRIRRGEARLEARVLHKSTRTRGPPSGLDVWHPDEHRSRDGLLAATFANPLDLCARRCLGGQGGPAI